jgi:hypothetical protein
MEERMKKRIIFIFCIALMFFLVNCPVSIPVLNSISPDSRVAHLPAFTLTATGTDFSSGSKIVFDGVEKVTTFVDSTELTCEINPDDIPTGPATKSVLVRTPGGGDSGTLNFTVDTDHSLNSPVKITDNPQRYDVGPEIAIDNQDNIFVVWVRWNTPNHMDDDVYFKKSTDGGATWSSEVNVSNTAPIDSGRAEIAVDNSGTIYVVWRGRVLYDPGWKDDIFLSRSTDGGSTWSTGINISKNQYDSDHPDIAVDSDGNINVVWNENSQKRVLFSRSGDGGNTWSSAVIISPTVFEFYAEPAIAVDIDDNLNVVWFDDSAGNGIYEINFSRSTNSGLNWSPATKVNSNPHYSRFPDIAADSSGNLHVVWQVGGPNNIMDIASSRSDDFGTSWSVASTVYNISSGIVAWHPRIAVDSAGNINVVWYNGYDYSVLPESWDILFCRSINNGVSWLSSMEISNLEVNTNPDIAVDSAGHIHVVWMFRKHSSTGWDIYYFNSVQ